MKTLLTIVARGECDELELALRWQSFLKELRGQTICWKSIMEKTPRTERHHIHAVLLDAVPLQTLKDAACKNALIATDYKPIIEGQGNSTLKKKGLL